MSLLSVLIALVIAGVVLWPINTYIPMDRKIKTILNVVVVIVVILWLLSVFGIFGSISNIHIGDVHMRR
jgi:predicted membrane protein